MARMTYVNPLTKLVQYFTGWHPGSRGIGFRVRLDNNCQAGTAAGGAIVGAVFGALMGGFVGSIIGAVSGFAAGAAVGMASCR